MKDQKAACIVLAELFGTIWPYACTNGTNQYSYCL